MNLILHNPLGLLALLSLPLIIWLHFYVVRGRLKTVSCLAFWQDPSTLHNEGQVWDKLPLTWILVLELCAAVLLSLIIAGLDWQHPTQQKSHIGIVIDSSASMAGGDAYAQVQAHLTALQRQYPQLTASVILSGQQPSLLGGQALSLAEAIHQLQQQPPTKPHHSLTAALELLALLVPNPQHSLVFSDDPNLQHPRKVSVGTSEANLGIVAADWQVGQTPFVVVRNFSQTVLNTTLTIRGETQQTVAINNLAANAEQLLRLPATLQQPLTVQLPPDALLIDNQVTLLPPVVRNMSVWVRHDADALQTALQRLINVLPQLQNTAQLPSDLLVLDRAIAVKNSLVIAFPNYSGQQSQFYRDLSLDSFHPLLAGFATQALVWYGYPLTQVDVPRAAKILLQGGSTPLLWLADEQLVFNIDLQRSNLLQHFSFPILMHNLVAWRQATLGGLLQHNYRLGASPQLNRASDWSGAVTLHHPSGQTHRFTAQTQHLHLARLDEAGIYRLQVDDAEFAFAVNFLDAREGDLQQRVSPRSELPLLQFSELQVSEHTSQLRQLLILLVILLLVTIWLLLEFKRV